MRRRLRRLLRVPAMAGGAALVAVYLTAGLLAPWLVPYDPDEQDLMAALQPPSRAHWLGTDDLGRDLASRVIAAARVDLAVVVVGILLAVVIAAPVGLLAGFVGGRTDRVLMTVSDAALTFPSLVLAVVLVSLFGAGLRSVIVAVALTAAPALARLIRSLVLQTAHLEYVDAARALGAGPGRLIARHVVPNIAGRVIVYTTLMGSYAMLTVTALGFLGLGVQPPAAEWGNMLATTRTYLATAPWLLAAPGAAIIGFIFGLNLLGDALRDLFDPKLLWRP
ncbi:MAG: ABC transporter permease [Armatimonadota bacterium]|nr:ABC transporter permease [Armatimonadota bacterium]MDR7421533.1 ABC transporter permease [Armatimonadota bacterium]MDR7455297.1 ABC transporter permease [Armatimonadota bacterium]MDR7456766.1 ABC transporter permease [Armatimonadota bacterium]MDR7497010.1 ABC transporter permease [Armatimonadota bacterium]